MKHLPALEDVQYYLRAWRSWVRAWRAPLGYPTAVGWVGQMLPSVSWDDEIYEEVDASILRKVDAEVESLPPDQRAAVRLVYLNEVLPAVFRSCRMTTETARRLCRQAELEMIPRLRARGVVLGRA